MKKSTEPSSSEMNKASTTEAKLSNKAEYVEKPRKENQVQYIYLRTYLRTYFLKYNLSSILMIMSCEAKKTDCT